MAASDDLLKVGTESKHKFKDTDANKRLYDYWLKKGKSAEEAEKIVLEALDKYNKEYKRNEDDLAAYEKKSLKKRLEEKKKALDDEIKYAETAAEKSKAIAQKAALGVAEAVGKAVSSTAASVDQYISTYANYMSDINTRIQGTNKSFTDLYGTIKSNIGSSPFVSQTKVLEKLSALTEKGIAYNLEQRAFLASVSENIAATFNAFDSSLLRIIKIQQADSTAARLGMEASLTQLFNSTFNDSSYLSSGLSNTISANLLEATAGMNHQTAVEFEYMVQKWLGSLGSVGVSDSTLSGIAQAVGWLSSGDISSLSGNSQAQSLLAMAASRAGIPFAELLTGGASSQDVNKLLKSLTLFIQEISKERNLVAKSEYGKLFGISMSDMAAISQLTDTDLSSIFGNSLSYSGAVSEVNRQLTEELPNRLHLSERINNVLNNTMMSVGMNIADNAGSYTTWLIADMLKKSVGGIDISAFGTTVNVADTMKTALVGYNLIGEIGNIVNGLMGSTLSLDNKSWNAVETLSRGTGYSPVTKGVFSGASYSGYVGNEDSETAQNTVDQMVNKEVETVQQDAVTQADNIQAIVDLLRSWDNSGSLKITNTLGLSF